MPKIDISAAPVWQGSGYPPGLDAPTKERFKQKLGDEVGLTQFGVNITRLKPGAASAHRHWHQNEDEFVYVLEGEATLIEETGETVLQAGEAAGFKAGVADGHCIVNRSHGDVVLLEVGTRCDEDVSTYPDDEVDLKMVKENGIWTPMKKNGERY